MRRPHHTAGRSGHSSREEVAGDSHQCGEPERREEGRGLSFALPRPGEQKGAAGDPGLRAGQSERHHGSGATECAAVLHVVNVW